MNFYDANRFIDYVFLVLLVAFCVWLVFGTKSKEKKGWKRKWLLITVFTFLFLYFFWWAFTMGFVLIFSPFFHISFALFFSIALFYGKSVIEKASSFFEKPAFSVLLMICTIASASLFGNEILEASTEKIRSLVEIGLNYNPQSFDFFDFLFLQNLNSIILPFYLISGFILLVPVSYFLRKSPSSVDYSDQVFARSAERFLFFPFLIAYSGMLLWNLEVFTYELITLFNLEWLAVNPYFIITIYAPIPVWLFLHSIYYKKIRNLLK